MSLPRTLLAIPAFNEERTIDRVLGAALRTGLPVLVVDDGSSDSTPARIAGHPVRSVRHATNIGYGRSLRDAFREADEGGFDWVITMDCDDQHCPSAIPAFLDAIAADACDVVSGSRYLRPMPGDSDAPGRRREVNMVLTREINLRLGRIPAATGGRMALGPGITDAFCGFKAHRVAAMRELDLDVDGYDFPLQFWVQAVAHGLRVDELPVPRIYLDPNRSFGAVLDDTDRRLAVYRATFGRELERCAGLLRPPAGSGA